MKTVISTPKAPAAIGPYSQAMAWNNLIFTSGQVPLDPRLRVASDEGKPLVLSDPDLEVSKVITGVAESLAGKPRGLAGMQLGISPAGR